MVRSRSDESLVLQWLSREKDPFVRKTYGLLYRTIYKDLAEAEFQFLRNAFEDHLKRCWWGTINRRNRRLSTATITAHPKLTIKQVARESKLQPALIRTFVRGSQIKSEGIRFPSGRTAQTVSISVDQAATALGLKQEVTYQLVRRGLISAQHVPQAGFRVCLESLQRFRSDYVSLSELSARSGKAPRRLLRELTARPVTGPQVDGARQYFFRRTEIFSQEEQT